MIRKDRNCFGSGFGFGRNGRAFGVALTAAVALPLVGCGGGGGGGHSSNLGSGELTGTSAFVQSTKTASTVITPNFTEGTVGTYGTGAIVAVTCPQGTWVQAFGWADVSGTPLSANTPFRIASTTKTFVAMAILELAQQGKVSLSDPISKYMANPDPTGIPSSDWNAITIEELGNHTSGLGEYETSSGFLSAGGEGAPWTAAQIAPFIPAATTPGTKYQFENSDFVILGLLVQQLTGSDPSTYIQSQFISPLRLGSTSVAQSGTSPALSLHGYNGTTDATTIDPTWSSWAGDMVSNSYDLLTWMSNVGEGKLLNSTYQPMLTTQVSPSLGGFGVSLNNGWEGYVGRLSGYSTSCFYNPTIDATVVVVVNRDDTTDLQNVIYRQYDIVNDVVNALFPSNPSGFGPSVPAAKAKIQPKARS